jgi:hypothetical protein
VDQDDVEKPVEDCLLTGFWGRKFAGEQADGVVQRVIIDVGQMEYGWECFHELAAHISGELVGAAEEHGRFRITGMRIVQMPG